MPKVLRWIVPGLAISCLVVSPSAVEAGFIASTTGAIDVISPPASALPGKLVSNDYQAWDESTGKLSSPLQVDMLGQPGSYDGLSRFTALSGTLAAGTKYDSVMVQLDPKTTFPAQSPIASITFTGKIIGLALFGPSLDASDIYGSPTTVYPHGLPGIGTQGRGINRTHENRFSITNNGLTLNLQLTAGFGGFEEMRIFCAPAVASVPEPFSLAIWSGVGLVLVLKRRSLTRSKTPVLP
ncbi:MAG TPA: hypothetical protein VEI07_00665 [Planctomycetaceae bacterium]|nr:hypothetical protein [Planctomycetaceae bacterium]